MPARDSKQPSGISDAAIRGAREGEEQHKPPAPDAKTVNPDQAEQSPAPGRATENNEAPMGGPPVAFPAPSAQPTRKEPQPTEQPAKVDVSWTEDEDDNTDWQRAGGGSGT